MRRILFFVLLVVFSSVSVGWCEKSSDSVFQILEECEAIQEKNNVTQNKFQTVHGENSSNSVNEIKKTVLENESERIVPEAENDGFVALANAVLDLQDNQEEGKRLYFQNSQEQCKPEDRQVYIIGAGIGGLSAASFLIRDGHIPGKNIHVMEELALNGGAMDGLGTPEGGYLIRGGRMLNFPTYECFWDLLKSIPSLSDPKVSVMDEMYAFNDTFKSNSKARLVDKEGKIIDFSKMTLSNKDRFALMKFSIKSEKALGASTIEENFPPSFFKSNFWHLWATMFAFQPWHSAAEMKRYMNRFMHECPRLYNLAGINRTQYNQYDSIILPIQKWLQSHGVRYSNNVKVTDVDFAKDTKNKTIETLYLKRGDKTEKISVRKQDLVFITNGSMTDSSTLGSMTRAPELLTTGTSFQLWEKMAAKQSGLGNPAVFAGDIQKAKWESFTVTCKDPTFFKLMIEFSGNQPGTGGLVTLKDSSWLMSVVFPKQPHFINQPDNIQVFWGYALFVDNKGDYVNKKMSECTGEEILIELCSHLRFNKHLPLILKTSNCIPCMMPFITSQFMPRVISDRPLVVPEGATNFGFVSQFCEVPNDCVFTVEYSVRAAQMAVYSLLDIKKEIPAIHEYWKDPKVLYQTIKNMFR
ncbi:MAG: oleate hydratase [Candidatus Riflebacteria bacterium]|nr:oleate hydratase [Candidatus Riflebacteria bacterium]